MLTREENLIFSINDSIKTLGIIPDNLAAELYNATTQSVSFRNKFMKSYAQFLDDRSLFKLTHAIMKAHLAHDMDPLLRAQGRLSGDLYIAFAKRIDYAPDVADQHAQMIFLNQLVYKSMRDNNIPDPLKAAVTVICFKLKGKELAVTPELIESYKESGITKVGAESMLSSGEIAEIEIQLREKSKPNPLLNRLEAQMIDVNALANKTNLKCQKFIEDHKLDKKAASQKLLAREIEIHANALRTAISYEQRAVAYLDLAEALGSIKPGTPLAKVLVPQIQQLEKQLIGLVARNPLPVVVKPSSRFFSATTTGLPETLPQYIEQAKKVMDLPGLQKKLSHRLP